MTNLEKIKEELKEIVDSLSVEDIRGVLIDFDQNCGKEWRSSPYNHISPPTTGSKICEKCKAEKGFCPNEKFNEDFNIPDDCDVECRTFFENYCSREYKGE